jgi:hypothetical protein
VKCRKLQDEISCDVNATHSLAEDDDEIEAEEEYDTDRVLSELIFSSSSYY